MEKENKKLKIIIAILVVVLLVLGAYHYFVTYVDKSDDNEDNSINDNVVQQVEYSDYVEEGNNYIYKYIFTKNNSYKSNIDIDDTYAIAIRPDLGKNIYILHDGKLYYNLDKCSSNDQNERICNFTNYNLTKNSSTDDLKLFDEIVNIKRIKSVNFGSGVDYSVLIITEEGKIYLVKNDIINNSLKYSEIEEEFNKYSVDDIVSFNYSIPSGNSWEVILTDGTTMKKTIEEKSN